MSVRLIITMCHRGRVNFDRVMVNDRRRRPEMEKYNICCCCCCSPRSLLILLLEPRGAAAGLIRFIFSKSFIITRSGTAPAVGLNRTSSSSAAAVTRLTRRVKKSYSETSSSYYIGRIVVDIYIDITLPRHRRVTSIIFRFRAPFARSLCNTITDTDLRTDHYL